MDLDSREKVQMWKDEWTKSLSSWHSPYKAIVDCQNLSITNDDAVIKSLERMQHFFKQFFLRKMCGFNFSDSQGHKNLPFEVFPTEAEAAKFLGIREIKRTKPGDFRSSIQFDNHFEQQVIELHFAESVRIDNREQLLVLKDKLFNNLTQWHSSWNLLIDCSKLEIEPSLNDEFEKVFKFFNNFFMQKILGYNPKTRQLKYPFKTFLARHQAAASLKQESQVSGRDANCATRKE